VTFELCQSLAERGLYRPQLSDISGCERDRVVRTFVPTLPHTDIDRDGTPSA